ncbi:putative MFS-type transporter [Zancudomyces culisetae]|uniref:Putative MFS-type transporter n=1 Tax=Zancudomyces culisetae TaxID=1213189 RepID=A0A1R1PUQ3_ZANCU|nr:putative MFS-type transporter [Zancudomyces culisetae]|eukprot:OMH84622.1 putative MFS-type transporter [Zancudomyces culisetae]
MGSSIGLGMSKKFWMMLMFRIGQGIGSGTIWSLGLGMLADIYPNDKLGAPVGTAWSMHSLGTLGGPVIGGVLYEYGGEMAIAWFMAGLSAACAILRFFIHDVSELVKLLNEKDEAAKIALANNELSVATEEQIGLQTKENGVSVQKNTGANDDSTPISASNTLQPQNNTTSVNRKKNLTMLDLIREPQIWICCFASSALFGVLGAIETILPIIATDRYNLTSAQIGFVFIALTIPNMLSAIIAGRITDSDRMSAIFGKSRKRFVVMLLGNCLTGIFCIILGLVNALVLFIIAGALLGFSAGVGAVPTIAAMAEHKETIGEGSNTQLYSLFNVGYSIAVLTVPIAASAIFSATTPFITCLVAGLFVIVCSVISISWLIIRFRKTWK